MSDVCKGEGCPRRDDCARYVDGIYFHQGRPFTSTLCEWVGNEYIDYYVPVQNIEMG